MRKSSVINLVLIISLLTMLVVIFSLIIAKRNYTEDTARIQDLLADRTIINYFTTEQIQTTYDVEGEPQEVILNPLCIDCDETIANTHNSGSMLITEAPESLCDTDVERCILYNYDPFGFGLFEKQEIIRNQK